MKIILLNVSAVIGLVTASCSPNKPTPPPIPAKPAATTSATKVEIKGSAYGYGKSESAASDRNGVVKVERFSDRTVRTMTWSKADPAARTTTQAEP
jgi:hypothetical protein